MRRKRGGAVANYLIAAYPPSTRKTTWLLLTKETEGTEFERNFLGKRKEVCPVIQTVEELAGEFIKLAKNRKVDELDDRLEKLARAR